MKRSKKQLKKLEARIRAWNETIQRSKVDTKAYKKPGSLSK